GGSPPLTFARKRKGKDEVRAYFGDIASEWEMIFYHVRAYVAQGNTVAVLAECCWRHRTTKRIVHTPKLDLYEFKGSKVVKFVEYFDNELAISACKAGEAKETLPKPPRKAKGRSTFTSPSADPTALRRLKSHYKSWHETKGSEQAKQYVLSMLAPEVSWGSLADGKGGLDFTRRRYDHKQVKAYLDGLTSAWTMNAYKVNKYVSAGPFVLALGDVSFTNKQTNKTAEMPKADLWRFSRGKAVEFFEYYNTAVAQAAASPNDGDPLS
ncbi:MAG: nuclear transport factor 2 family protein, partial [Parvibaculaceae bacterium]